ncbi:MAG: DNA topoisomerase VI subunit B [Candidatus Thorarchaeota archaeon]|nr:DNA topoisomerase VI subunit B [Candidatus Thorarchaeota archaeon]
MSSMSHPKSIEASFGSISPAEFFYRNRQMAGFGNPTQAVYSTVRELVENSLDSCDDAQNFPKIDIDIQNLSADTLTVTVSDNGTGVPPEQVPFAFGRVLYGSKYSQQQKRGTFGLGVTMAILYGQITTDSPVVIHTRTETSGGHLYRLLVDVENNLPLVEGKEDSPRADIGTTVSVQLKGDLKRSQERIVEYLRLSTLSTPHAEFTLRIDEDTQLEIGGWSKTIPEPIRPAKPHPRSVDMEVLRRLISKHGERNLEDFLCKSFQKIGKRTASRFLRFMNFSPSRIVSDLNRDELSHLAHALRKYDGFERPDSRCLSPIGKNEFLTATRSVFNVELAEYASLGVNEWQGNPFVMEAVIATGDEFPQSDIPTLFRFVNRVPLLYDASDGILTRALKRVNWSRYNGTTSEPAAIFLHLCSTKIPFKAAGKQSLASIPEIEHSSFQLFRELGRKLGRIKGKSKRSAREMKKMREFSKSLRQIARFGSALAGCDDVPPTDGIVKQLFEVRLDE